MKKYMFMMITAITVGLAGCSSVPPQQLSIDGKPITIVEAKKANKGDPIKVSAIKHGVYITAINGNGYGAPVRDNAELKKTIAMIRAMFATHGIKTVDAPDGADYALSVGMFNSKFAMSDVEQSNDYGNIEGNRSAGAIVGAILGGGVQTLFSDSQKDVLVVSVFPEPHASEHKGTPSVEEGKGKDQYFTSVMVEYKVDTKNPPSAATLFRMEMTQWFKNFIVQDAQVPTAQVTEAANTAK